MGKYLKLIPKPFLDDLVKGNCVPLIGAGFSRNAIVDDGSQLPIWDNLGQQIAAQLGSAYHYDSALDAISAYVHEFDRSKLVEELCSLLYVGHSRPGRAHAAFAEVPFRLVVTTNFEMLLEQAYSNASRYCHVIVGEEPLSQNMAVGNKSVSLLKMHGDIAHPAHLVVTEDDYDEYLTRYPLLATFIGSLLIQRTALFLGYSMSDPHFRMIWRVIGARLNTLRRRAYTFSISPSQQTQDQFWRRGVRMIALPGRLEDADNIFADLFDELAQFWNERSTETSVFTSDEPKAELILTSAAAEIFPTRICFIDCPVVLLAFYKETIYPIVEKNGLTPMTLSDVVFEGLNITAVLNGLIERAAAIMIDVGSGRSNLDIHYVRNHSTTNNIIVVHDGELQPSDLDRGIRWLRRPNVRSSEYDNFVAEIDSWLRSVGKPIDEKLLSEPERLLRKGETRAAFVSAFSLLEARLRARFTLNDSPERYRPAPLSQLLRQAEDSGMLTNGDVQDLLGLYRLRSSIIHEGEGTDTTRLKSATQYVLDMAKRLAATE